MGDAAQMDFFEPLDTDEVITGGYTSDFCTTANLNDGSIIEYFVPPSRDFAKMNQIVLHGKYSVVVKDKTTKAIRNLTDADDDVSTANILPSALWKLVSLYVNNVNVTDHSSYYYSLKAYLETLLNYSDKEKESYLKTFEQWYADTDGESKRGGGNEGYTDRAALIKESKEVEFFTKLHIDVFKSPRLLLNGVALKLTLHRNPVETVLISPDPTTTKTYILKLKDLRLRIPYAVLQAEKVEAIARQLTTKPAEYPYTLVRTVSHDIPAGSSGLITRTIAQGTLPNLVLVGMIQGKRFENLKNNPFYFNNEAISRVFFKVNGQITTPAHENIDFKADKYLSLYHHFVKTLGLSENEQFVDITKESFKSRHCFMILDVNRCKCDRLHPPKMGNVDINLSFKKAPEDTISLIVFSLHQASMTIDKERKITLNSP